MAQTGHSSHSSGGMDTTDQKQTFSAFMSVTVWSSLLIVMSVAGLVVAFALPSGWFAGVLAYTAIGFFGGLLLKLRGAWWATLIVSVILLLVGGAVVSGILALT